jgi:ComF family protein
LLLPPACLYCGKELPQADARIYLCPTCIEALIEPVRPCCPLCGTVQNSAAGARGCIACQERKFRFDGLTALGDYQGDLRSAVLLAKRAPGESLTRALARLLWRQSSDRLREWQLDTVVAVPMHWTRLVIRGMNPPDVIAEELARTLQVPLCSLLRRRRRTRPQGTLSPSRRASNVRGAFHLDHANDFRGARVLVVDDVVTSGATSNEVARVLKRAGAAFVGVAAIARTQPLH